MGVYHAYSAVGANFLLKEKFTKLYSNEDMFCGEFVIRLGRIYFSTSEETSLIINTICCDWLLLDSNLVLLTTIIIFYLLHVICTPILVCLIIIIIIIIYIWFNFLARAPPTFVLDSSFTHARVAHPCTWKRTKIAMDTTREPCTSCLPTCPSCRTSSRELEMVISTRVR